MFKQRKHKTFNYNSVLSDDADTTVAETSKNPDFISKWRREQTASRKVKGVMSLPVLILALVLLLICMYVLDAKFN